MCCVPLLTGVINVNKQTNKPKNKNKTAIWNNETWKRNWLMERERIFAQKQTVTSKRETRDSLRKYKVLMSRPGPHADRQRCRPARRSDRHTARTYHSFLSDMPLCTDCERVRASWTFTSPHRGAVLHWVTAADWPFSLSICLRLDSGAPLCSSYGGDSRPGQFPV